jgi:hypothetical protein
VIPASAFSSATTVSCTDNNGSTGSGLIYLDEVKLTAVPVDSVFQQ